MTRPDATQPTQEAQVNTYPGRDELAAKGFDPMILEDIGNAEPKRRREYVSELSELDEWRVERLNTLVTKAQQASRNFAAARKFAHKIGE